MFINENLLSLTLARVAQWAGMSCHSWKVEGSIPGQGTRPGAWVAGLVPGEGV